LLIIDYLYNLWLLFFFKVFKKTINKCLLIKKGFKKSLFLKKSLFFKKKLKKKTLFSRRISTIFRKKNSNRKFIKKQNKGNFFFKKFFFKTLLKARKNLKGFFYFKTKTRQKKITKMICAVGRGDFCNTSLEYGIINILLRSQLFFFNKDAVFFLKKGFVFVNGRSTTDEFYAVTPYSCIQLPIFSEYYFYIKKCRKFFRKNAKAIRFHTWKFFFHKRRGINLFPKTKRRKTPKYLYLFFLFRLGIPKNLEIDYLTLSVFFFKIEKTNFLQKSFYLYKFFSLRLFSLYNYKALN